MEKQKKREKMLTPNPFFIAKALVDGGKEREIRQSAFESQVVEVLQKARGYTNARLKKFPVDEHGFFLLRDLDAGCLVRILHRSFDPGNIFKAPDKIRRLYDAEAADIVVLNDFEYRSCQGIALAAMGVIHGEDMLCVMATIPSADCSPIYVGPTADMFATLVAAGHISKWNPTQEENE